MGRERTRAMEEDLEERSGGGWRLRRRGENRGSIKRRLGKDDCELELGCFGFVGQ